jgi:hypothetical protein
MHRLHNYPDVQVMFRRLLIATLVGMLAALAVALFHSRWGSWKGCFSTIIAGVWSMPPKDYPAGDVCSRRRLADWLPAHCSGSGNVGPASARMRPPTIWKRSIAETVSLIPGQPG